MASPSHHRRDVWITGTGVVTAFGRGCTPFLDAMRQGSTAAAPPWSFDVASLPVRAVAELREPVPDVDGFPDDRKVALLFLAAEEALAGSGFDTAPSAMRGVFLGTGLSSVTPHELNEDLYPHLFEKTFDRAAVARDLARNHAAPRRHLPARAARALAKRAGALGSVHTSFSACAAGSQAMGAAFHAIARGEIDQALAGGHDSMTHPFGLLSFLVLGTLCEERCRPFDRQRNGFLLGEGAGVLVMESAESARARGIGRPLARFLGAGTSMDAYAATAPHPDGHGAWLAMVRALKDAGLRPAEVDQVNAHGTGTPVGDVAEARAIARLFPDGVRVCSLKGAVGHTIAAAGAVEIVGSILAMNAGFMPGTTGCTDPAPECPIDVTLRPVARPPRVVLSNSFGFGGQNSAIVVGCADRT
jgi:3-oxoacyl-[acyl-carrier-protein] synthase II